MTFTVGFDLDMTLIDPRAGMVELFGMLAAETGIPLDGEAFVTRLGPPLAHEFARYDLDEPTIGRLVARYRALYQTVVVGATKLLPGAREAIDQVRRRGGEVVIVSGKQAPNIIAHLRALSLEVDAVAGELWSTGKAGALREHCAEAYVGDHVGDIAGARAADALAIGVATGPMSAADLSVAGADVVLDDLTQFPAWLSGYLAATVH